MDGTRVPEPSIATTAARARRLWDLGAFERARTLLGGLAPDDPEAQLAHADFALHTGDVAQALAAYTEATRRRPGNIHAARGVAAALIVMGRPVEALDAAEQAHALVEAAPEVTATERANVLTTLGGAQGLIAQRGGMLAKFRYGLGVRQLFERAAALYPANPHAHTALGRWYLAAPAALGGDAGRALEELEAAMAGAPFYYVTHAWYVRALEANGVEPEASRQRALYEERYAAYPGALAELAAP